MSRFSLTKATLVTALALTLAAPLLAQSAPPETVAETRLRALEAEVRALQRQVFPGGDGKYFAPQVQPAQQATPASGTPASTPVSDLLVRMDAVEAQLARLTAQGEENGNKITQIEARLAAPPQSASTPASPTDNGATTSSNLAAMTAGATAAKPAVVTASAAKPVTAPAKPAISAKPASATAQRLAAVKAVARPATNDPGDDEYSYAYRLWDAKFYPEAQQQLKMFLQKYPRHARLSYARNLLGRAYLDEGNPREAASWFLQNYQADKKGDRAPDSLLMLAEAMRQLKDTNRACVALAQFSDDYPKELGSRLRAQYDATRSVVKCN